jgi:hypothetical protein
MMRQFSAKLLLVLVCTLLLGSVAACSGPDDKHSTDVATSGASDDPPTATTAGNEATAPVTGAVDDPTATAEATTADPTDTPADPSPTSSDSLPTETPTATANTTLPEPGAGLLPQNRVISYYGHPNDARMGILGEYTKEDLLAHLQETGAQYEAADPTRPVVLAFEIIATVAHDHPAQDNTYLTWTDDELIREYVDFATANGAHVILDLQIGLDTIEHQIESVRHWLELPNVHVALDPEFSMKANETVPRDRVPGTFIGEVSGHEVNTAIQMVAAIVAEKQLPTKILIVHQFENEMIYYKDIITPLPGVDFVLDMDGFGGKDAKIGNYGVYVNQELIQYGGIKLFFRQDDPLMTPEEVVALEPSPLVVIYQ